MKRKVLVVCIGGTVRSVGIADIMKGTCGYDALAASAVWQPRETMLMLCRWADFVMPVEPKDISGRNGSAPHAKAWAECAMWDSEFDAKRIVFDVGPDVWGNARHPEFTLRVVRQLKDIL